MYDIITEVRKHGFFVLDNCEFKNPKDFECWLTTIGKVQPFEYSSTASETVSVVNNLGKQMPQAGRTWNSRPAGDWHIDSVFTEEYPEIGCLYAHSTPTNSGDTIFADSRLAIKDLSENFINVLRSLKVIHYRQPNKRYTQESWEKQYTNISTEKLSTAFQSSTRDLIMKDFFDQEFIMLSPSKAVKFEGWTEEESRGINEFLQTHVTLPEYTYRHRWKEKQVVFWLNNVMNHYGVYDYHGQSRELWRAYLK